MSTCQHVDMYRATHHVQSYHKPIQLVHYDSDCALGPFPEALLQPCLGPMVETLLTKFPASATADVIKI